MTPMLPDPDDMTGSERAGALGAGDDEGQEQSTKEKKKLTAKQKKDICDEARKRYTAAKDADKENRDNYERDLRFVWEKGAQWPQNISTQRGIVWNQPCLEINQLPQFVKQVVNDQRQNPAGIKVSPASGEASIKSAELLQGVCRGIEYRSQAQAAYDQAFEQAVTGGRGYWRVISEYESSKSFNQVLKIKPIADALSVIFDPDYLEPDASDWGYCFVCEVISKDAFKAAYPKADPSDFDDVDTDARDWFPDNDGVVVADYYRRICTQREMVLMSDGKSGWKDTMPKVLPAGVTVVQSRECDVWSVEWYKIAGGNQILEVFDWPGETIPVVPCIGDEIIIKGKRIYQGLIRRAIDSQRAYNYANSAVIERAALSTKAPWIMAEGQDEGHEDEWDNANKRPYSALHYKPTSFEEKLVPPPQQTPPVKLESGMIEIMTNAKADLRATIGIYDPSLGQRSNEVSGRAIMAREKQGDTATYHFVDNRDRAVALTGRIMLEVIPHFYDTHRIVTIVDEHDDPATTAINQPQPNPYDLAADAIVHNDVCTGEFAVTVSSGPSYQSKRQETAELTAKLVQAFPPIMQVAGDLVVKSQDIPDADAIAERLAVMLPPPIQQQIQAKKDESEGKPQVPPQAMAQMNQMHQQLQQAGQAVQQLQQENQELKTGSQAKVQAAQMGAQADQQIAMERAASDERMAEIKASSTERIAILEQKSRERIAEINGMAGLMEHMLIPPQTPIPDTLPGEMPSDMGAPAGGAIDPNILQALVEALGSHQQQMAEHTKALRSPRQLQIHTDANGDVIGGTSTPMLQ